MTWTDKPGCGRDDVPWSLTLALRAGRLTFMGGFLLPAPWMLGGSTVPPGSELTAHLAALHGGEASGGDWGFAARMAVVGRLGPTVHSCSGFLASAPRSCQVSVRALPSTLRSSTFPPSFPSLSSF